MYTIDFKNQLNKTAHITAPIHSAVNILICFPQDTFCVYLDARTRGYTHIHRNQGHMPVFPPQVHSTFHSCRNISFLKRFHNTWRMDVCNSYKLICITIWIFIVMSYYLHLFFLLSKYFLRFFTGPTFTHITFKFVMLLPQRNHIINF